MASGPPPVDLTAPPVDLDRLLDGFDTFSSRLVLLEEYSIEEVRAALDALRGPVLRHCHAGWEEEETRARNVPGAAELLRILRADHERFSTSIGQLDWFCAILARENHGGHRQALGQYGRVLVESFRRHRADEDAFLGRTADPARGAPSRPPSGKRY